MARMIPTEFDDANESSAEKRLFFKFRDELSHDWVVLHSLKLTNSKIMASKETDFVLVGPKGVYCFEAKTGGIQFNDGLWYTGPDRSKEIKDPYQQAQIASSGVYKYLDDTLKNRLEKPILVGNGVLLPDVNANVASMEFKSEITYDIRDRAKPISAYIDRLFQYWCSVVGFGHRISAEPYTSSEINYIVKALRPNFDLKVSLSLKLDLTESNISLLTQEQYEVVEQFDFDSNPKMIVRGGAGTGKTLCAIELAKLRASQGDRVLLTCFNRKLASSIRHECGYLYPNLEILHLHELMTSIVNKSDKRLQYEQSTEGRDHYYQEILPLAAWELLADKKVKFDPFDTLLIDEAQDLLLGNYMGFLQETLSGGFELGRWVMFLDQNHSIFQSYDPAILGNIESYRPAKHYLKYNCRNTQATTDLVNIISNLDAGTSKAIGYYMAPIWYRDRAHEGRQVANLLSRLVGSGVSPDDIVMLSHRDYTRSGLESYLENDDRFKVHNWRAENHTAPEGTIKYCTIQSFKGLEAKVIILVGIDSIEHENIGDIEHLRYVAGTRATGIAIVSLSETLKDKLAGRFVKYDGWNSNLTGLLDQIDDFRMKSLRGIRHNQTPQDSRSARVSADLTWSELGSTILQKLKLTIFS